MFLLMLAGPFVVLGQESTHLWTGLTIQKNLNKKWALTVNGQWRFTENVSLLGAYIGEAGLGYKINKRWKAELNYRYIGRRKYDKSEQAYYYRPYHRFYGDISYDRKTGPVKLEYRIRYQNQFKDDDGALENQKSYVRNRLEVSYPNKTRITPFVSGDVFYLVGGGFEEIRWKAGTDIKVNKHHSFTIGAFTTQEISTLSVSDLTIVAGYKLKF